MTTDAELIKAARADADAFGELYRRHVASVHAFLRSRAPERVAGELTAETFAQAALSLGRFRDEMMDGSALPWLYGIARNLLRTFHERERIESKARQRLGMPARDYELEVHEANARVDAERLAPDLSAALATLPPTQRQALQLRVIEELPYRQVALSLDCSEVAARIRVTRAIDSLFPTTERSFLMTIDLEAIGRDLQRALERRTQIKRRRSHRLRVAFFSVALTGAFATVAYASGIGADLQLDPTKWAILGGGSVEGGRGAYVHAKNRTDGSNSTFLVEHGSGLPAYQAFLLHEKTLTAANATSPVPVRNEAGGLCSADLLTRAETVAMDTLRAAFASGSSPEATRAVVTAAVARAFQGAPCKGLEYAGEQARLVYSGRQPASTLMPGARN